MHAHKHTEMINGQILIHHFKTPTTAATCTFSISYNQHVIPLFSAYTHAAHHSLIITLIGGSRKEVIWQRAEEEKKKDKKSRTEELCLLSD